MKGCSSLVTYLYIISYLFQIPNYHKIITHPMDFATMRCKLRSGHFAHYNKIEEFLADVKLVFQNCFTYNAVSNWIGVCVLHRDTCKT